MTNFRFAIVVISPNGDPEVYTKPASVAFPVPVGTGIHIDHKGGMFAVVNGYSILQIGDKDFYIFLSPEYKEDGGYIVDPKREGHMYMHSHYFGVTDEEFDSNEKYLLSCGWEVFSEGINAFPRPFFPATAP